MWDLGLRHFYCRKHPKKLDKIIRNYKQFNIYRRIISYVRLLNAELLVCLSITKEK